MKKSIFDIQLMNGPCGGYGKTANNTNSARLANSRKGFIKINSLLL
jgi:hypothetical protein